ncbi:hypothetical protein M758_3G245700 [Ceratodon purpureus]|uniref:Uncharacterized protein n=1 Tax=Ceratodon purpureus TaxID=3225 RepID=A0A8T0IRC8_CERPU|nr:hypothetical protein KC19_3G245500 [Ceratodon purpureus]KAG0624413.1 hypothetical protein M758_3G245700 [Ceratodon purpureus]
MVVGDGGGGDGESRGGSCGIFGGGPRTAGWLAVSERCGRAYVVPAVPGRLKLAISGKRRFTRLLRFPAVGFASPRLNYQSILRLYY